MCPASICRKQRERPSPSPPSPLPRSAVAHVLTRGRAMHTRRTAGRSRRRPAAWPWRALGDVDSSASGSSGRQQRQQHARVLSAQLQDRWAGGSRCCGRGRHRAFACKFEWSARLPSPERTRGAQGLGKRGMGWLKSAASACRRVYNLSDAGSVGFGLWGRFHKMGRGGYGRSVLRFGQTTAEPVAGRAARGAIDGRILCNSVGGCILLRISPSAESRRRAPDGRTPVE
eukprot:352805-Chlamydomonas_euryale.AAC.3